MQTSIYPSTTICAPATAQGGAINIIRCSGTNAINIVNTIFSKDILSASANKVVYGSITNIDDVLVTIFRAPHSYTGEDCVEISCHGSRYITNSILDLLMENGCTMAAPGEFTQRAFLNGKMDLSQAEAVADLISSNNAMQHRIAINQMRGAFSSELSMLSDRLLEMTSLLELELDFSEEDVQFADRQKLIQLADTIQKKIDTLIQSYRIGNVLKEGIPVAIVGAPNVGKSTLLNHMLHEEKAIVSDIQGTTRDIIEDSIQIDGYTFRFLDTAGIRDTDDKIEKLGIERSIQAVKKAFIVILMTEEGVPYPSITIRPDQTVVYVKNKTDILTNTTSSDTDTINISALTGLGIDILQKRLIASVPDFTCTDTIITSRRQLEALMLANTSIIQARQSLESFLSGDLVAEDLRQCIFHLSTLIGRELLNPETTLKSIFSSFCIGK